MVYTVLSSNSKKMPSKGLSEDEILNKSTACLCINDAQYVVYLTALLFNYLVQALLIQFGYITFGMNKSP